eukprot:1115264-Amphidinium_carterae.1
MQCTKKGRRQALHVSARKCSKFSRWERHQVSPEVHGTSAEWAGGLPHLRQVPLSGEYAHNGQLSDR